MTPGCGPPLRATTFGADRGDRASVGQIFAHLPASGVELILCNNDKKMKEWHGVTYAACPGTEAAVSSVRWRTTVAPAVRRHSDTSEPAW